METDFIYCGRKLPNGIEVAEIFGGEDKSPSIWREMALQIFADRKEANEYQIDHYPSGAPFIRDINRRISITHTGHFIAIALLPQAVIALPSRFSPGHAIGIDAERQDRTQVQRIRERFLSEKEQLMIGEEDQEALIQAWTVKEAVYKAMLTPGLDFRRDIEILRLPKIKGRENGHAIATLPDGRQINVTLYSWESEGHCLTVAKA